MQIKMSIIVHLSEPGECFQLYIDALPGALVRLNHTDQETVGWNTEALPDRRPLLF